MAVTSLDNFATWVRTYIAEKTPHRLDYDERTGVATLYSKMSRTVVAKTVCEPQELRAAGVSW